MSNRRAQDERIEGTPDGSNAISEIVDVPDAPTIGTATADIAGASVPFTAATTGGTPSLYTATSNPGAITGTSATSPITVSGLTVGTAYTFTVTPSNSTGTGPASSSSNSITPVDLISAYDHLATVTVPSDGAASVEFTGIPITYEHLQIRGITLATSAEENLRLRFNSDTGANYSRHYLGGNGSTTFSAATANENYAIAGLSPNTTQPGVVIIDILDYASTSKNKVSRALYGDDKNGGTGYVFFSSGSWFNTSAVTSINLSYTGTSKNFLQYSQFALYGVK